MKNSRPIVALPHPALESFIKEKFFADNEFEILAEKATRKAEKLVNIYYNQMEKKD